jgi:hypothetical protein
MLAVYNTNDLIQIFRKKNSYLSSFVFYKTGLAISLGEYSPLEKKFMKEVYNRERKPESYIVNRKIFFEDIHCKTNNQTNLFLIIAEAIFRFSEKFDNIESYMKAVRMEKMRFHFT